jgi:hypothetical protein
VHRDEDDDQAFARILSRLRGLSRIYREAARRDLGLIIEVD